MAGTPRSAAIHPGPGFQVAKGFPRLDAQLVSQFSRFPTPDISDQLNRLYAMDPGIQRLTRADHRLCGLACTVKVFPGDNLMVHKVLDIARPGDVVVIDAHGSTSNAVLGDIITAKAKHRHIAGFVIDGLVRDLPDILELDVPVFARGTTTIGPLHRGPGEINFAISCGGIVINPGDVIAADGAGIVSIPHGSTRELLGRLEASQAASASYLDAVRQGKFSNEWVDRLLETHECRVTEVAEAGEVEPAPLLRLA